MKNKQFYYENKFYEHTHFQRFQKKIFHYEIFKMIKDVEGSFVEVGVFKGNSFVHFAFYRNLIDGNQNRKMYAFDIFGKFPKRNIKNFEKKKLKKFINDAGENSYSLNKFNKILKIKKINNYQLVKGDVAFTIPKYSKSIKKISLLHIDTDLYQPCKITLDHLYDKVSKNGIILFDNYNIFPGETKAVDEFIKEKKIKNKLHKNFRYYIKK